MEAEALVGVVDGSELCELGGLDSRGSEPSLLPDEEGTSTGRQEAEEGGEDPLRLAAEGGLLKLHGTSGGGELPAEGTDTELRSNRSVTDPDSSPGLENKGDRKVAAREREKHLLENNPESSCLLKIR